MARKKKTSNKVNKKWQLLIIAAILMVVVFGLIVNSSKKEGAVGKKSLLCDTASALCQRPQSHNVPKGVCIPGGKCT